MKQKHVNIQIKAPAWVAKCWNKIYSSSGERAKHILFEKILKVYSNASLDDEENIQEEMVLHELSAQLENKDETIRLLREENRKLTKLYQQTINEATELKDKLELVSTDLEQSENKALKYQALLEEEQIKIEKERKKMNGSLEKMYELSKTTEDDLESDQELVQVPIIQNENYQKLREIINPLYNKFYGKTIRIGNQDLFVNDPFEFLEAILKPFKIKYNE